MTDATTTPTDKAGEPVAWRYRSKSGTSGWMVTLDPNMGEWPNLIVQPLYTHPQPSLSVGLDKEAVAKLVCREMGYDPDQHIKGGQATDFEDFGPRWKAARNGHWHGFTDYEEIADQIIKGVLALAAPAEGWRGIETAPKDGAPILLSDGDYVVAGGWCENGNGEGAIWTDYTVASWGYELYREITPTHWMPLPAAPTGETGA